MQRWYQYFKEILGQDTEEEDRPEGIKLRKTQKMEMNTEPPKKVEIIRFIKKMKMGKAYGRNGDS